MEPRSISPSTPPARKPPTPAAWSRRSTSPSSSRSAPAREARMHGHSPRKRFGQHFLADPHYVSRIVAAVAPARGDNVVEIGPGLGALTGALIERAGRIAAIEIDRDLAARLRASYASGALALHETDALAFDFATL